jgi:hypothetical protein
MSPREQVVARARLDGRQGPESERLWGRHHNFQSCCAHRVAGFDSVGVAACSQGQVAQAAQSLELGGVDSAVERTGGYRVAGDRDRHSDGVS